MRETRAGVLEPNVRALRSAITTNDSVVDGGDVPKRLRAFRATVWAYYHKNARHELPWRKTKDPYKILVSEIMLQQTQVPRVIEKYKEFLKAFPTVKVLARSDLAQVLKVWSGLGYNRRGKYLHDAAKEIVPKHRGDIKAALIHPLPGVGPYTKSAVRVFAFNEPDTLLETNIRAVFIHHFFSDKKYQGPSLVGNRIPRTVLGKVTDTELLPVAQRAAKGQDPRTWNWALMDYGAYLKRSGIRNNHRSAHYTKQSEFEGSLRQVRGAILRELYQGPSLVKGLPFEKAKMEKALEGLARDGLIKKVRPRRMGLGPKKGNGESHKNIAARFLASPLRRHTDT